jgi:MFS family permease
MPRTMNLEQLRRQGWWNVAAGFAVWMFIVVMPAALMPILYVPIMDDTGWSRGQVTMFSSFKFGAGACIAFVMGHLIDRLGLNKVMMTSFAATGLALASLVLVHSLWGFYLVAAILGAAIVASTTGVKILISRWFSARLGSVIGLALAGGGAAGVIVPRSATFLNGLLGWRLTTLIMSSGIFLILVPFYLWKARATPAAYGYTVEELDPIKGHAKKTQNSGDQPEFRDLLVMQTFWVVFVAQVLVGAVDHSMQDHLPLFLARDAGLGLDLAAWGFTIATVASALGKIGFGWLFDRHSVRAISLCCLAMAVAIALAFPVAGLFTFALFTLVQGAVHGGILVEVPICSRHVFGQRSLSKTIAIFAAANSLGAAIAIGGVGFMHDALHSYTVAFIMLMVLSAISAAMLYRLEPKYWSRRREVQVAGAAKAAPAAQAP